MRGCHDKHRLTLHDRLFIYASTEDSITFGKIVEEPGRAVRLRMGGCGVGNTAPTKLEFDNQSLPAHISRPLRRDCRYLAQPEILGNPKNYAFKTAITPDSFISRPLTLAGRHAWDAKLEGEEGKPHNKIVSQMIVLSILLNSASGQFGAKIGNVTRSLRHNTLPGNVSWAIEL